MTGVPEKAIFQSMTVTSLHVYNKELSSQCNLPAHRTSAGYIYIDAKCNV